MSSVIAHLRAAIFGLAVQGVNMYGFTTVFLWFEATRDWITVAAHLVLGVCAVGVYSMLARLQCVQLHGATNDC